MKKAASGGVLAALALEEYERIFVELCANKLFRSTIR